MFADRYELGASLGRGGMAEVFEAVAHGTHGFLRRVAIKRLRAEFGEDPNLVRMFLDEARIASHLHHSGIVAVLDFGVVDNCPFQVLELVEGWDAARLVGMARQRRKQIPVEVALLLANQVAHALAYAHARKDEQGRPLGIVHRDVKPSNILVSRSGDIKLGDFGIALARERSAVSAQFGARGTPGFMSPEQLLGTAVGPAADIFAVGISLYGFLTGESPLANDGYRLLMSGAELQLSNDLPLDAREIVFRAVRMRPEERYGSARELAQAIGEALAPRLETDPTTRITQWVEELEAQRPSNTQKVATAVLVPLAPGKYAMQAPTQSVRPPLPTPHVDLATMKSMPDAAARYSRPSNEPIRPPLLTPTLDLVLEPPPESSPIEPTIADRPIFQTTDVLRVDTGPKLPPAVGATTMQLGSTPPPRAHSAPPAFQSTDRLPPFKAPVPPQSQSRSAVGMTPSVPVTSRPVRPASRPGSRVAIFVVFSLVPLAIGLLVFELVVRNRSRSNGPATAPSAHAPASAGSRL